MKIVCVQCGVDVTHDAPSIIDQTVVICSGCGMGLRVTVQAFAVEASPRPPLAPPSPGEVLVAVCGEATRECIREVLSGEGFEVVEVETGRDAVQRIQERSPQVAIIDVGLPDMMGYHVCEAIRREPRGENVKILLVAAMYNEERFKRQPASLYGADGFLERHQIEDELLPKLRVICEAAAAPVREPALSSLPRLDPPPVKPVSTEIALAPSAPIAETMPAVQPHVPVPSPPEPVFAEPALLKRVEPGSPPVAISPPLPQMPTPDPSRQQPTAPADPRYEPALRLARIIVSDIALYNAKKVEEGVLRGTFFDLLRSEIDEGRRLYQERCPPDLTGGTDYFQQTLETFVETRRRLLQRRDPAAA